MLLTKVSKSNLEYIQIKKSNVHFPYLSDTSSLEFLAADSGNELKTLEGVTVLESTRLKGYF